MKKYLLHFTPNDDLKLDASNDFVVIIDANELDAEVETYTLDGDFRLQARYTLSEHHTELDEVYGLPEHRELRWT